MIIGFGLQVFEVAFWVGLVMLVFGFIITGIARQIYSHNQDDKDK